MGKEQLYRDRYFSDNQPVRVAAKNRKGYRTVYQYVGLWKAWESAGGNLKRKKRLIGLAELVSLALYLGCAAADTPINRAWIAGGLGVLAVIPWLLELYGVVRFLLAKEFVKELSLEEIDRALRYGCPLRAVLSALSALAGMGSALQSGNAGVLDAFVLSGILISASLSLVIWRLYGRLLINTYRNANGNPGTRI